MKLFTVLSILILVFGSCNYEKEKSLRNVVESNNEIIGIWKLVYTDIKENDSLTVKDMTKSDFVKIINSTHFAFFNQDHDDASGFYGGAGSYKLEGNQYTETLNFFGEEVYRGQSFQFTVEIKGDTLIQSGLEEVKEANIKRYITEKYIRVLEYGL